MNKTLACCCRAVLLVTSITQVDNLVSSDEIDYSYYLGKNYKAEKTLGSQGRTSKVIANHTSLFDIPAMICHLGGDVSFVGGSFIKGIPLMGSLAKKLGTVFVPRSGSKTQLQDTLQSMVNRTELIEREGQFPPICIFPEGTTSNGQVLTKFRKGAFYDQR